MIDTNYRHYFQLIIDKIAAILIKLKISADMITIVGSIIGIIGAFLVYWDKNIAAVILLWISGLCDVLDGTVARSQGGSPHGAMLDIILDRIVELAFILAIAFKIPESIPYMLILVSSIVICMSVFLTAGILIQKEHIKSFYYSPGIMERTEAFIMLTLFILFPRKLPWLISIFSSLIFYTGLTRFIDTVKILNLKNKEVSE